MVKELQELLDWVAAIPASDIEEPDLVVGPQHQVVGKIDDLEMRKLFTGYWRKVRELDHMHSLIKGPMRVSGMIPDAVRAKMCELQEQMDLLRIIFFYAIAKKFQLFDRQFINVHEGWLVSWSRQATPTTALPNLGTAPGCADPNDDNDDD